MALFVAVVITSLCCCLCTGYHLHRRRRQLHSLFEGRDRAGGPGAGAEPVCTRLPARSPSEGHVWAHTGRCAHTLILRRQCAALWGVGVHAKDSQDVQGWR